MNKKTVRDIEVAGKRLLVRVDFNVPFHKGTTAIADDSRIRATLPTLRFLLERNAAIILCSHLGRPDGQVVEELRLAPVAQRLSQLLERPVTHVRDCIGREVEVAASVLEPRGVLLLENLRFHPEEEANDVDFARRLAALAEVYVNDAFGAAHRAHASTEAVARYLPAVAGLLMERELQMLGAVLDQPRRPLVAVIGGAKVSDKLAVLEHLAERVDALLIGGGMAATFLRAQGLSVGASPVEEDRLGFARSLLVRSGKGVLTLLVPEDVIVAEEFAADAPCRSVAVSEVPEGWHIMDIGPRSVERYTGELGRCKCVVWNGPMGVCEWEPFAAGTRGIARALADLEDATTVVGGGSTTEAVEALGLSGRMTHVSTGGGASLELLEGKTLPGVTALQDKE